MQKKEKNGFESVEKLMTSRVPVVNLSSTIADVEKLLSKNVKNYDSIDYIYVVDRYNKLKGVISIKDIFRNECNNFVKNILKDKVVSVKNTAHQEKAALLSVEYNLKTIPVVSKENIFLGVLTSQMIVDILHKEGIEDSLRTAGIKKFKNPALEILEASTFVHLKKRLPWLLIGLVVGVLAAIVIDSFESLLEAYVLLVAFIPSVVYMADAVGEQAQILFIRSLSLDGKFKIKNYLFRELKVNLVIGIILSLAFYLIIFIGWGAEASFFGAIIGISIFIAVISSMIISIALPFIFQKLHFDSAITSGPIGTALRDLSSLMIYFSVASFLVARFL